jgi:hypothetical protein
LSKSRQDLRTVGFDAEMITVSGTSWGWILITHTTVWIMELVGMLSRGTLRVVDYLKSTWTGKCGGLELLHHALLPKIGKEKSFVMVKGRETTREMPRDKYLLAHSKRDGTRLSKLAINPNFHTIRLAKRRPKNKRSTK